MFAEPQKKELFNFRLGCERADTSKFTHDAKRIICKYVSSPPKANAFFDWKLQFQIELELARVRTAKKKMFLFVSIILLLLCVHGTNLHFFFSSLPNGVWSTSQFIQIYFVRMRALPEEIFHRKMLEWTVFNGATQAMAARGRWLKPPYSLVYGGCVDTHSRSLCCVDWCLMRSDGDCICCAQIRRGYIRALDYILST